MNSKHLKNSINSVTGSSDKENKGKETKEKNKPKNNCERGVNQTYKVKETIGTK